jgi:hypothetical protein
VAGCGYPYILYALVRGCVLGPVEHVNRHYRYIEYACWTLEQGGFHHSTSFPHSQEIHQTLLIALV